MSGDWKGGIVQGTRGMVPTEICQGQERIRKGQEKERPDEIESRGKTKQGL
jgi:hypothetical protein